jgi:WD40 repeat protein
MYSKEVRMKPSRSIGRKLAGLILLVIDLIVVTGSIVEPVALAHPTAFEPASVATGNLNTPRAGHTATLLPTGKVLIAGGLSRGFLNSTELYDPGTGSWSYSGNLNTGRHAHTATLLPNGKVLVAGGATSPNFNTDSAELYDPAIGTWSITGHLRMPRSAHTATLLQNGKVLVAGGLSANGAAELYDPDTETWSLTDNLSIALFEHTATLISGGKVLVVGGLDEHDPNFPTDNGPLPFAKVYDPDAATWRDTGYLTRPRASHTSTLLPDGKVLVAGGYDFFSTALNSAELYDPATGTWHDTGNSGMGLIRHTATLMPNGKVLVAGGNGFDVFNRAEQYDPYMGGWSLSGSLITPRVGHTATLLPSGKVLFVGGNGTGNPDGAELYDPDAPAVPPRIIGASVSGKKLFVFGENFDPGAVILLNGEEQKTRGDDLSPGTTLIGRKTGKKINSGDKLQIRNPNGTLSQEFIFAAS